MDKQSAREDRPLPAVQQRNFRAVARADKKIRDLTAARTAARQARHAAMLRVFAELEKHPEGYSHETRRAGEVQAEPLTRERVRELRKKYEDQALRQDPPKNPRGGPGCADCEDIFECWCAFSAGPLCCYVCFSWKVVRCYF
ncbi:MAG: hypothetical protein JWM27_1271 [Gemmatimonadetes bacterium]|nr:hypothetical protein [Gemmatimonadota bacterium]